MDLSHISGARIAQQVSRMVACLCLAFSAFCMACHDSSKTLLLLLSEAILADAWDEHHTQAYCPDVVSSVMPVMPPYTFEPATVCCPHSTVVTAVTTFLNLLLQGETGNMLDLLELIAALSTNRPQLGGCRVSSSRRNETKSVRCICLYPISPTFRSSGV